MIELYNRLREPFSGDEVKVHDDGLTTINPQAIIRRLNDVFGLGSAKLVITDRKVVTEGKLVSSDKTEAIEVFVSGYLKIKNGLVSWKSSGRTKGFPIDKGQPIGNSFNAAESLLWVSCARELGVAEDYYLKEEISPDAVVAKGIQYPTSRPADKGASAVSDARKEKEKLDLLNGGENANQEPETEENTGGVPEATTTSEEVKSNIDPLILEMQKQKNSGEALALLEKHGHTREIIFERLGIDKNGRLSQKRCEEYLENFLAGKYSMPEPKDLGKEDGDEEPPMEESGSADPVPEEGGGDLDDYLQDERKTEEAMQLWKDLSSEGLSKSVYDDFLKKMSDETGIDVWPEELDYEQYTIYASDLWIDKVKEYLSSL